MKWIRFFFRPGIDCRRRYFRNDYPINVTNKNSKNLCRCTLSVLSWIMLSKVCRTFSKKLENVQRDWGKGSQSRLNIFYNSDNWRQQWWNRTNGLRFSNWIHTSDVCWLNAPTIKSIKKCSTWKWYKEFFIPFRIIYRHESARRFRFSFVKCSSATCSLLCRREISPLVKMALNANDINQPMLHRMLHDNQFRPVQPYMKRLMNGNDACREDTQFYVAVVL